MTVYRKENLLLHHAFSRLRLVHAAFVDSFEVHAADNRMPVNRFLFVAKKDSGGKSIFRDIVNNKLFPMRENNLYFIPCNHLIDLHIEADLHFFSFQFNLDILYGFDAFEAYPRCEARELPELNMNLPGLLNREGELETLCRVNQIIYGLCADFGKSVDGDMLEKLSRSARYRKILEFIRDSGNATVTVDQLAGIGKMRRDVFSRNFTRDLGISPKTFISDTLVRKASEMLMFPGIRVKEVAEKLQFSSEYYFSNFFKKRVGISPRNFQRYNGIT